MVCLSGHRGAGGTNSSTGSSRAGYQVSILCWLLKSHFVFFVSPFLALMSSKGYQKLQRKEQGFTIILKFPSRHLLKYIKKKYTAMTNILFNTVYPHTPKFLNL